ncbi:uncharacterized protein LOC106649341 isoform X1 [Trichogramma pretiosum]|uniref:uncharacterized protein LOC106649341 isoform X1 n=1 Tax=Trichogramma pretiosum TaxID=7493 RepID=UPI0006C98F5E|nr:uncharacterized protein LOC106649341 isoform X1 [Trichogramma pretiosum]
MRLLLPQLPLLLLLLLSHGFATTEAGAIEHIDASQHQQQIGGVDGDDAPSREAGNTLDQVDKIGLPIYTTLNGSVTNLNEILPNIHLNRTKAFLNCSQGSMQVDLMFAEPFYGLAYANFDRFSACITKGRGANSARIELPLKGCGTVQDPPRVFTNNIVVRFHPAVEMDGDEVITIVCRYPPARAEKPGPLIAHRESTEPPPASGWNGFHLLLLICTLLFMALLLTGLSCSYVCLKRRPVSVIHRQTFAGSEITKISGSSALSRISMFDDFKIPRIIGTQQTYGSEAHLVVEQSDTLPSDYPSESHSEVDEERSLPVSSAGSYETKAFVHREVEQQRASSSLYSETINEVESTAVTASRIISHQSRHQHHHNPHHLPIQQQHHHNLHHHQQQQPKFDVQMRVKHAPPPPSPLPSESETSVALERNLTTILEREESSRITTTTTTTTNDTIPRLTTFSYAPELHAPPPQGSSRQQTPPVYSRILRKQQAERETSVTELIQDGLLHRPRSLTSLNTEMTDTRSLTEVTDSTHAKYRVASMLAPPANHGPNSNLTDSHLLTQEYREQQTRERVEPLVEPVVAPRRPEITTHEVDDVFLRTVTEKRTIEDIERHRRQITEYHAKQKELPNPKWDVTIRNYPQESGPSGPPEWENFSDVSSASNLTVTLDTASKPQEEPIVDEHIQPTFTIRAEMTSETEIIERWHNLERPLEPQFHNELSDEERTRWREIITTESTLRKLLTEAFIKEDFELIRKDVRYTDLFSPDAWDVIIRIVSYPERPPSISSSSNGKSGQRYKRGKGASGDWDNRSRRSSLPTLYEYENDVDGQEHLRQSTTVNVGGNRIRKLSSTTRGGSEADLRSMSEMTVRDFARMDRDDQTSLSSFEGDSLVRSLSQPSLARSGSEFTEHWGVQAPQHLPNWDEPSSTETTPRPVRREVSSFQESTAEATPDGGQIQRRVATYSEIQSSNTAGPSGVAAGPGAAAAATSSRHQRARWFQDDSEPEMQI